jgi:dTDP-4-amino-4,6-dideoxygalactose transaminase
MKVPLIDLKAQYKGIQEEIQDAIQSVLETQKFILDSQVHALEEDLARFCNTKFTIACASGTDAILLSLIALGIEPGDEVITTAYSFFSTAGMIAWIRGRPVFVDVDRHTFNMRPELVGRKITPKTKAILAVHLFGQCCRIEELLKIGPPVIEDAGQAIGAMRNHNPAGSVGITGCFSFFPTKNLGGYGDGGFITTNNPDLAAQLRELRAHGEGSQKYVHDRVGTNSRLDEIQACVIRVKLKHLNKWNELRRRHAAVYSRELANLPIDLPRVDPENTPNFHQYVIQVRERDRLRTELADREIGTGIYYPVPLPLQPCFSHLGYRKEDYPEANQCSENSLALPIYPELTEAQLAHVISSIRSFYK